MLLARGSFLAAVEQYREAIVCLQHAAEHALRLRDVADAVTALADGADYRLRLALAESARRRGNGRVR